MIATKDYKKTVFRLRVATTFVGFVLVVVFAVLENCAPVSKALDGLVSGWMGRIAVFFVYMLPLLLFVAFAWLYDRLDGVRCPHCGRSVSLRCHPAKVPS